MTAADFNLSGRVALITGAAGHLGQAMSEALAYAGAHVYLNGRDAGTLKPLRDRLIGDGLSAEILAFDVTDMAAISSAFERIADKHARLDVLLNNAYAGRAGNVQTSTASDFSKSYEIAVTSPFLLVQRSQALLEAAARASGSASVINIASMYGSVSPDPRIYGAIPPNPPFYGAAKGGLLQLTRYLAVQLAPLNIRVNAISPGPVPSSQVGKASPDFLHALETKVPMGRTGRPQDLKGAVVFLASEASSFVTGINLPIDGGWTAW